MIHLEPETKKKTNNCSQVIIVIHINDVLLKCTMQWNYINRSSRTSIIAIIELLKYYYRTIVELL